MALAVLRIYMPVSAKRKGHLSLWQKLFHSSLANFLLCEAKEFGVEQSLCQRITAGYLKGKKLVFDAAEAVPDSLPQCVELIDKEETLKSFAAEFSEQLNDCRVVLFQGAEILKAECK